MSGERPVDMDRRDPADVGGASAGDADDAAAADALLRPQPPGIPVPVPDDVSAPYWDACRHGELWFQRCEACGSIGPLPARRCPTCMAQSLTWERSSGTGRLYSWTVVWRPQHPAFRIPYAPAIVELREGWRMVSAVVGCRPGDLVDGMALAVTFHPASDTITLPYFEPALSQAERPLSDHI